MADHIISPTLFDSIDEYVELLRAGTAISGNVVPETSPLISFSENVFAQFFENETHTEITGFDIKAKRKAARLRRAKRREFPPDVRSLIALFEQFCDIRDDVLGAGYGGQESVLEEFHFKHVVRLLERICVFAEAREDNDLKGRAASSLGAFVEAIEDHDWSAE